jgi:hypothetical protein
MPALVAGIHAVLEHIHVFFAYESWMVGTSPAMTAFANPH